MYLKLNDIQKGLEYCKIAAELDPENSVALINLGDIMRQVKMIFCSKNFRLGKEKKQ